ncbi:MAG: hypothetical protein CL949_05420 [Erythrobacter sp.]|nr:hypothetical protein [Erythrobacter sp.]|tara:strand:- start:651 stop:917 length:267 start_codon:yes stop_codon:yes gene_type:complete
MIAVGIDEGGRAIALVSLFGSLYFAAKFGEGSGHIPGAIATFINSLAPVAPGDIREIRLPHDALETPEVSQSQDTLEAGIASGAIQAG